MVDDATRSDTGARATPPGPDAAATPPDEIVVVENPPLDRFEARAPDGTVLGFAAYVRRPGVVVFTHTEVAEAAEGRGIGGRLAQGALDAVRASGQGVVPLCPFIRAWIRRHPDYRELVRRADALDVLDG